MPKALLCWVALLLLGCLLPATSHAVDYRGGQLTYETLGANRYLVRLRVMRDCAGGLFNPTETLSCRVGAPAAACASTDARNFTAPLTLTGSPVVGTPYCAVGPTPNVNQCGPGAPPNYEAAVYTGTVTLAPAAEWTLSWEACCRSGVANLQNSAALPLRLEATLRNQLALAGGAPQTIQNTSPQYQDQDSPVSFVCGGQRSTLTFSTLEPDGDSLVYTMETPLAGCNQPATYASFATGGALPLPPGAGGQACLATLPAGAPTAYSNQFPLLSFMLTGTCPAPTATPQWGFTPQLGAFTFTPAASYPASTLADRARNQYAVVGKVTEYRRLGGVYYEVGTISRNMQVVVINCADYQYTTPPLISPLMQVYGQPQLRPLTDLVQVAPGQSAGAVVTATDPDPGQTLTMTAFMTAAVPAGAFRVVQRAPGEIGLEFSPPASLPEGAYPVQVRAEDNGCPTRLQTNKTVTFYVSSRPLSTAPASRGLTTAAPNPFTDAVTFRVSGPAARTAAGLEITNVLGQVVARLPLHPDGATATATWRPAPYLPAGVYLARVPGSDQVLRLQRR